MMKKVPQSRRFDRVAAEYKARVSKGKPEHEALEVHVKGSDIEDSCPERELTYPGADADDVFATTESELAASSGEAANSGARASGTAIAAATPLAKSVGELLGSRWSSRIETAREGKCHATATSERQAPTLQTAWGMVQVPQGQQQHRVRDTLW